MIKNVERRFPHINLTKDEVCVARADLTTLFFDMSHSRSSHSTKLLLPLVII